MGFAPGFRVRVSHPCGRRTSNAGRVFHVSVARAATVLLLIFLSTVSNNVTTAHAAAAKRQLAEVHEAPEGFGDTFAEMSVEEKPAVTDGGRRRGERGMPIARRHAALVFRLVSIVLLAAALYRFSRCADALTARGTGRPDAVDPQDGSDPNLPGDSAGALPGAATPLIPEEVKADQEASSDPSGEAAPSGPEGAEHGHQLQRLSAIIGELGDVPETVNQLEISATELRRVVPGSTPRLSRATKEAIVEEQGRILQALVEQLETQVSYLEHGLLIAQDDSKVTDAKVAALVRRSRNVCATLCYQLHFAISELIPAVQKARASHLLTHVEDILPGTEADNLVDTLTGIQAALGQLLDAAHSPPPEGKSSDQQ